MWHGSLFGPAFNNLILHGSNAKNFTLTHPTEIKPKHPVNFLCIEKLSLFHCLIIYQYPILYGL